MFFRILQGPIPDNATDCAYLIVDGWDDWFSFRTMFTVLVIDELGVRHQIGSVKIGRMGLQPSRNLLPGFRAPELPLEFDELPETHFSLGQGEDYYESLNNLSAPQRQKMLEGLRDVAYDLGRFARFRYEPSMVTSLLRSVNDTSVTGRLHRLTTGDAELTKFSFQYVLPPSWTPNGDFIQPPEMTFDVIPESEPPTNVHVLIGRNGVGKTRAMKGLVKALLHRDGEAADTVGKVEFKEGRPGEAQFSSLVLVSFSAFDDLAVIPHWNDRIAIHQVGLRDPVNDGEAKALKLGKDLAVDFRKSLERCQTGLRAARWREALSSLEADDLFAEAEIGGLLGGSGEEWAEETEHRFSLLSSGHAIVLLTITRLVELVDERTLVIIDEPEGHLHPPLLSAFIRSLSRLLVSRNGVAIVATHSPVALQEVPRSCTWKLRRTGRISVAERPTMETFGENVGVLTREVFSLEVTRTGYHMLLVDAVFHRQMGYNEALHYFGDQLGAEAKAIIRALVLERDRQ